jgi:hypothetical protein
VATRPPMQRHAGGGTTTKRAPARQARRVADRRGRRRRGGGPAPRKAGAPGPRAIGAARSRHNLTLPSRDCPVAPAIPVKLSPAACRRACERDGGALEVVAFRVAPSPAGAVGVRCWCVACGEWAGGGRTGVGAVLRIQSHCHRAGGHSGEGGGGDGLLTHAVAGGRGDAGRSCGRRIRKETRGMGRGEGGMRSARNPPPLPLPHGPAASACGPQCAAAAAFQRHPHRRGDGPHHGAPPPSPPPSSTAATTARRSARRCQRARALGSHPTHPPPAPTRRRSRLWPRGGGGTRGLRLPAVLAGRQRQTGSYLATQCTPAHGNVAAWR